MLSTPRAFVVGYTGETGRALVKEIVQQSERFSEVCLVGRRNVEYEDPQLQKLEQRVVDFENPDSLKEALKNFDVGYCCLGTTRAKAGSAEAFKRVDYDYVHEVAVAAKEGGTKHFHLLSSAGANKDSYFLYPKIKGLIEEAVKNLLFDRVSIYRPKILDIEGGREESRILESVSIAITKGLLFFNRKLVLTEMSKLCKCIVTNTFSESSERTEILNNDMIYKLSEV